MSRRMTIAMMLLSICICALPRVQAQATNWLLEAVMVGVPQTQIVRDPKNRSRYYLCWSDGSQRYGLKFSSHLIMAFQAKSNQVFMAIASSIAFPYYMMDMQASFRLLT